MNRDDCTTIRRLSKYFPWLGLWLALAPTNVGAWDYEGHRIVNQLALATLPTNFPAFVKTAAARERIGFLGGEPDRWRNTLQITFRHAAAPDHYFDLDELPRHGLDLRQLPPFRYSFVKRVARAPQPEHAPNPDPNWNADQTRDLIGFLPWTINEYFAKLQSGFSSLKEYESAGSREEIANAQANIIYVMGVLGHFVGDGSQPLHSTLQYNGWVGPNPRGYTTNRTFHAWIDGGFLRKAGVDEAALRAQLQPATALPVRAGAAIETNVFAVVLDYLQKQFELVEPLYQLDQQGKLSSKEPSAEGRDFLAAQLVKAAQMLGTLWIMAWQQAPPDTFLRTQLARRKLEN